MVDETTPNSVAIMPNHRYDTDSPPLARSPSTRRRSMIRGKTFDEDSTISKSARTRDYTTYDGATKSTTLDVGITSQYRVIIHSLDNLTN